MMKDLSYLQVFPHKVLKGVQMIMRKGFTLEDIETFIGSSSKPPEINKAVTRRLEKPCCGDSKIDKELAETKAKQEERRRRLK